VFDCSITDGTPGASAEADAVGWFDPIALPASTRSRHVERIRDAMTTRAGPRSGYWRPGIQAPVILFGGQGAERLVSVASAQNIARHWRSATLLLLWQRGDVVIVPHQTLAAHARPFEEELAAEQLAPYGDSLDRALTRVRDERRVLVTALHGGAGEDGQVAAICERLGIPFTASGSTASALAWDKVMAKACAAAAGLQTAPSLVIQPSATLAYTPALAKWLHTYGALVAKPVRDGSSHGIRFLDTERACSELLSHDRHGTYLVEPLLRGSEASVGVVDTPLGPRALEPVEIQLQAGAQFDYEHKYLGHGVLELCPSTYPPDVVRALRVAAETIHRETGAWGYSRSDFILTDVGPALLELNVLPGMTQTSLFPKALAAEGIELGEFLRTQAALAIARAVLRWST